MYLVYLVLFLISEYEAAETNSSCYIPKESQRAVLYGIVLNRNEA